MNNSTSREGSILRELGILTPTELRAKCVEIGATEYLIEDLLPKQSISLLVGDSGLGKSPLLYQAAVCVASGRPFLGHSVRQGSVLYLDCENGLAQASTIIDQVSTLLGTPPPNELLSWNMNSCTTRPDLEHLIRAAQPNWVVVDPLKAFFPDIETDTYSVGRAYRTLRKIMSAVGCSITGVHHLRKASAEPGRPKVKLESPNFREWFNEARGAREIINGCDVRIGVDLPASRQCSDRLVMRGFGRVRGEIPLMRIERVVDDNGEPLGFRRLGGVELLDTTDQQTAFSRLQDQFRYKEAKVALGKGDEATTGFLRKCETAGLIRKLGTRLGYEKIRAGDSAASAPLSISPDVVPDAA